MSRWSVVLSLGLGLSCFLQPDASAQTPDEKVLTYGEFEGRPLQFVFDRTTSHVILRVEFDASIGISWDEKVRALGFLKGEVMRLALAKQPMTIGETGYSFSYTGGYLLWQPYTEFRSGRSYECLLFAELAEIRRRTISASGTEDWQEPYPYPYIEPMPIL